MTRKPNRLSPQEPIICGDGLRPCDDGNRLADAAPPKVTSKRSKTCVVHKDLGLRIDQDGVWYYHGSAITRKELVCLFASVLVREADGRYWLVTPAEMGEVEVEDAPFIGVELFAAGDGCNQILSVRTNTEEIVTLDESHPLLVTVDTETDEPSPYITTSRGLSARLSRPVYYELVERGVERIVDGRCFLGVWSCGQFFALGALDHS